MAMNVTTIQRIQIKSAVLEALLDWQNASSDDRIYHTDGIIDPHVNKIIEIVEKHEG